MKRFSWGIFFILLAVLGFCPSVFGKPTNMKAVAFLPPNHAMAVMAVDWVKKVNTELKDHLNITLGGPEVIPGMQQVDAVRDGVVDIAFSVTAYFTSLFPEGWAFFVSKYTPMEERKSGGFYDYMVERFRKIDMMYLGRWMSAAQFYLWTSKPVSRLEDLRGMKMRTGAHFDRFMKRMGMVPVTVMTPDVYTALERGTVDGFGWPLMGPRETGWTDTCKYIIDHPFHGAMNAVILMNLSAWNNLPKDVQSKLISLTADYETDVVEHFKEVYEKEWKMLEEAGVKRVYFPQEDAQKYLDTIHSVDWEILNEKVPSLVPELKRITGY